jgi:hypothetical protein
MFLRDRDWSFPMEKLERRVFECFPSTPAEKFCLVLGDVKREWNFLSLLWRRLRDEYREFSKCEKAFQNQKMTESLSRKEISDLTRRKMVCFDLIHLDTEDSLIHAKILLDLTVILAKQSFKEMIARRGFGPPNGFTSFRKWFLESKNSDLILDIELANYLRCKTDWFERLIRARDKLIVHRYGYDDKVCRGNESYTDAITTEGKTAKAIGEFVETGNAVRYRIKEMPVIDFALLLDGISAFLHFFDEHFSSMLGAIS